MYTRALRTAILAFTSATLLAACGGGGSGGGDPPGGGSPPAPVPLPPPPPPTPPPPPPNNDPVLSLPIPNQAGIELHPFMFDVTQGGRTFTDADGEALTYSIAVTNGNISGLRFEGTNIVGNPYGGTFANLTVQATDGHGFFAVAQFSILLEPNRAPTLNMAPDDVLVAVGAAVNVDATAAGNRFRDADGDALTYQVAVRGTPGLTVDGGFVRGSLPNVGAVEVVITANDGFGGASVAKFLVAAPAPPPGPPLLPATSYIYEDAQIFPTMPSEMRGELQFNSSFPPANQPTNAGATLGRVLFHDKRLSITNTVACADCHKQDHAFATPNRFDTGVLGLPLKRNSMTLTNSRANPAGAWFLDMRALSLKDVAASALTTNDEMGGKLPAVEAKLRATPFYAPLFQAAFGTTDITGERILLALEQYVQSVLSYRSRYDQVCLPMDNSPIDCSSEFTVQELRGQEIFETNQNVPCIMCHRRASNTNIWQANNGIDDVITDPGTFNPMFTRDGSRGVFRAASLRNIALTAPYMHDGRFATLREVIDHYDHGIKASSNLDPILGGDGAPHRLNISEADKDALEAFLRTLTDEEILADPKFSDPFP
jgi:cytochrome c peroxidase